MIVEPMKPLTVEAEYLEGPPTVGRFTGLTFRLFNA